MTIPILNHLGGRERVYSRLKGAGYRIRTPDAVRMWEKRGRVPGAAAVLLMKFAEEDGVPFKPEDFEAIPPSEAA